VKNLKLIGYGLAFLTLTFIIGYSVFWFKVAGIIETSVQDFYNQAYDNNIKITEDQSSISGFPGPHSLSFSGSIEKDGLVVIIPELTLTGFPFPGQDIALNVNHGFYIKSNIAGITLDKDAFSINALSINTTIPDTLPYAMTVEALRKWRDSRQELLIHNFYLKKSPLEITGNGTLALDENLQPKGIINIKATGHMAFAGFLQDKNIINIKAALIAGTILNGLSRQNPETGQRVLEGTITLQNQKLLLGPLQMAELPRLQWGYDNPPAQPLPLHVEPYESE